MYVRGRQTSHTASKLCRSLHTYVTGAGCVHQPFLVRIQLHFPTESTTFTMEHYSASAWIIVIFAVSFANAYETVYLHDRFSGCSPDLSITNSGGLMFATSFGYDNNLDCIVTLRASPDRRILITLDSLDINVDENISCGTGGDYLEIFDGEDTGNTRLALVCGEEKPTDEIASTLNAITLRWKTDAENGGTGFTLKYTSFSVGNPCEPDEYWCLNDRCIDISLVVVTYSSTAEQVRCGDQGDITEIVDRSCSQTVEIGEKGGLLASQFSATYDHQMDCTVILNANYFHRILLYFHELDLYVNDFIECGDGDFLEIFDGEDTTGTRLAQVCGNKKPGEVTSSSNTITLRFKTDDLGTAAGFKIVYTVFTLSESCYGWGEFKCDNNRCINVEMSNTAINHCKDPDASASDVYLPDNNDDIFGILNEDDIVNYATGLLRWGIGVLVAIIIGILALTVLICVCCGCLCYHTCCKSRQPQQRTVVVSQPPQPGEVPPPTYNQQPPIPMQNAPYGQGAPYEQEALVKT